MKHVFYNVASYRAGNYKKANFDAFGGNKDPSGVFLRSQIAIKEEYFCSIFNLLALSFDSFGAALFLALAAIAAANAALVHLFSAASSSFAIDLLALSLHADAAVRHAIVAKSAVRNPLIFFSYSLVF